MFIINKKLRAISSPCNSIFIFYSKRNRVYKIAFLNDPTGYRNEYFGEWKLAKMAFLEHIALKANIERHTAKAC